MNMDHIRHQYGYHHKLNRTFWDYCVENLTWEQVLEENGISVNTIRNQFVHLMDVEERWFNGFKGAPNPGSVDPALFDSLDKIREKWDNVEAEMKSTLDGFTDEDLEKTYHQDIMIWHVLAHVVNHGTAHRAQIGAMLRRLGLKPPPQDYIFYVMGRI
jgi:uncharacterized damage-inducible protein DinB